MNEEPGLAPAPDSGSIPEARKSRISKIPWSFLVLFGFYLLVGNFVLALSSVDVHFIEPWTKANAAAAAALTRLFGFEAKAAGTLLSAGSASLSVKGGCDGVHAVLILASAVMAFPVRWGRRFLGILMGAIAIFGFNILRLVSLLLIAAYFPAQLEFFHVYVWQTLIALLALGTFILWGTFIGTKQ